MRQDWSEEELIDSWSLTQEEKDLILAKKERLSFAIKLKYYKNYGALIYNWEEVADCVKVYIRTQIDCVYELYDLNNRTSRQHNAEIREHFGFSKINEFELNRLKINVV